MLTLMVLDEPNRGPKLRQKIARGQAWGSVEPAPRIRRITNNLKRNRFMDITTSTLKPDCDRHQSVYPATS
jgi:hypothetical protein